jgi:hypothetical protein
MLSGQNGGFTREFSAATQVVLPPTSATPATAESRTGTNALSFDVSGTLLATRVEDMPSTVWIWDVGNRSLRAVLILHAPIARIAWHPTITELLMIRCEGEENKGRAQLWDPSWEMPKIINFGTQVPEGKIIGKSIVRWLNIDHIFPSLFFSDTQDYILASLSRPEDTASLPWSDAEAGGMDINDQPEESPLNLVEPTEKRNFRRVKVDPLPDDGDSYMNMSEGSDQELDDTFHFLKSEEP